MSQREVPSSSAPPSSAPPSRGVRARDLGLGVGRFEPGPHNAITDVAGVRVGHVTLWWGDPPGARGQGPARTGVTALWPHDGDWFDERVYSGAATLSGVGEMTGAWQIAQWGVLSTPIALTSTASVGAVYDGVVRYLAGLDERVVAEEFVIPVVAECDDSWLNDAAGFHVLPEHAGQALERARSGPVEEGAVGAGSGMTAFGYKGGIGTSSRVLPASLGGYRVGVLVNANLGRRHRLTVGGRLVGMTLPPAGDDAYTEGSCIGLLATDAPLIPGQLQTMAARIGLGLARLGSIGGQTSGEIFLAWSTANRLSRLSKGTLQVPVLPGGVAEPARLDALLEAAVDASEEAALNAMLQAPEVVGFMNHRSEALPHEAVRAAAG